MRSEITLKNAAGSLVFVLTGDANHLFIKF